MKSDLRVIVPAGERRALALTIQAVGVTNGFEAGYSA